MNKDFHAYHPLFWTSPRSLSPAAGKRMSHERSDFPFQDYPEAIGLTVVVSSERLVTLLECTLRIDASAMDNFITHHYRYLYLGFQKNLHD
jgi:hypothetical protein